MNEVKEALKKVIITISKKENATPEELTALAKIADVLFCAERL